MNKSLSPYEDIRKRYRYGDKVMIGEDTGRDDDPRSRCSLIGSGVGVYIFNNVYTKVRYYVVSVKYGYFRIGVKLSI